MHHGLLKEFFRLISLLFPQIVLRNKKPSLGTEACDFSCILKDLADGLLLTLSITLLSWECRSDAEVSLQVIWVTCRHKM